MAAPTAPIMGFNGKLYYNSASYASPTWVLIDNVGDVKMTDEMTETEIGLRVMSGFSITVNGMRKLGWEWSMLYDPADTEQTALRSAYAARTATEFLILDQANGTAGSAGIRVLCLVTKFPRQEEIDKAMMVDVAIKPTYSANVPAAYTAS